MDSRALPVPAERLLAEHEWLVRLARSLVSARDEADDLVQDTLVAALQHPPADELSPRPWLARIAKNISARRRTSDARRAEHEASASRSPELPSAADIVARVALQRTVVEAVLGLDEPYRSTILLRYWDDMPPRLIAAKSGVLVETVRTRLKRGLAVLRDRLDRSHGGRDAWVSALLPVAQGFATSTIAAALTAKTALMSTQTKLVAAAIAALLVIGSIITLRLVTSESVQVVGTSEVVALQEPEEPGALGSMPASREPARSAASGRSEERPAEVSTTNVSPRTMRVVVVDQDLQPLLGARVEYFSRKGPSIFNSDLNGACSIELDPGDSNVEMEVQATGYRHARGFLGYRPEKQVKLRRTIALSGRILDSITRQTISSATVSWIPDCCRKCTPISSATDLDGTYRLEAVPFDTVTLRAEAPGYPPSQQKYELNVSGEVAERDIMLARGLAVRGRVVDFTTGLGLPGATVSHSATKMITDETGRFEGCVQDPGSESIQFTIECVDRCQLLADLSAEDLRSADSLVFRLPESPIVEGVVYDPAGQPVAGVSVGVPLDYAAESKARSGQSPPAVSPLSVLPKSWTFRDSNAAHIRTNERGAFRIVGLVPWSQFHNLLASQEGLNSAQNRIDRLPGPGERLVKDSHLKSGNPGAPGYARGRVYLNGVQVPVSVAWNAGDRSGEARADPTGYSTEKLPPGQVELRALIEGCAGSLEGDSATVVIAPGKSVVHDFDVKTADTRVRGRVLFTHGGPAARANVTFWLPFEFGHNVNWMQSGREARTAEDGSFSLLVPACDFKLRVIAKLDAATAILDGVRPGDGDLRLALAASGTLLFRVIDTHTLEPLDPSDLTIAALTAEGKLIEEFGAYPTADSDGWTARTLSEGPIELLVMGARRGYCSQRVSVLIAANAKTQSEIKLDPALRIRFRLEPPPDERWKDHSLFVIEPDRWSGVRLSKERGGDGLDGGPGFPYRSIYERKLAFDAGGAAMLQSLGPGEYRLKILPEDIEVEPPSIELTGDTGEPIVVHWKP